MTNWVVVLAIILPLLFSRVTIDSNVTPRYIFLSSFMLLFVLFFYSLRKTIVNVPSLSVKIIFGLGIGFGVWSIVCMANAINVKEGYYEVSRHVLNLILLFLVMTTVMQEEPKILKLCKALLLVSMLQSFVGILQNYGIAFTDLPGNYKPYGLMANRNLFGSAQVLLLPFVAYVLYKASKGWKYLSIFALTGLIISVLISQTRSAWIGSISILMVSLILVLIFSPANRKKWMLGIGITIISIGAIVSIVLVTDTEGVLSQSIRDRAVSLSQSGIITNKDKDTINNAGAAGNANERIRLWKKTIDLIRDKPVWGVGPSNWKVAITAYGTDNLVWAYGNYVPDRPHNVYLLVAAETGIPGAILFFGMWVAIGIIAFKVIHKSASDDRRILVILMLAGLSALAIDGMFSFPTERIEHSLYMTLMGGIIVGSYINIGEAEKKKTNPVKRSWLILVLAIIAFNLFIGIKKYNFETHINQAKAYLKTNKYQQVINEAEAGKNNYVTLSPNDGRPIEIVSAVAYKELKNYSKALEEITIAQKYNPNNAGIYNNMGTIYTDMKDYNNAIKSYLQALKFAPKFDIIYKNLSVNYYQSGNDSACIAALAKINIKDDEYLTSLLNSAKIRLASKK